LEDSISFLARCPLFDGLGSKAIGALLECLSPVRRSYEKNSLALAEGEPCAAAGVVLSGLFRIVRDDYWGNRTIVAQIEPGGLFGEAFAAGGVQKMPLSVMAAEKSEALLFDLDRILRPCASACAFHRGLIKNMVSLLARKNIALIEKIEHLTQRSTRAKALSYLSSVAKQQKSSVLEIPFNRQELADYLAVERSALSAELCRMRGEGLLEFRKNRFRILR
jgi:CRP-like cAMP-binding protein